MKHIRLNRKAPSILLTVSIQLVVIVMEPKGLSCAGHIMHCTALSCAPASSTFIMMPDVCNARAWSSAPKQKICSIWHLCNLVQRLAAHLPSTSSLSSSCHHLPSTSLEHDEHARLALHQSEAYSYLKQRQRQLQLHFTLLCLKNQATRTINLEWCCNFGSTASPSTRRTQ